MPDAGAYEWEAGAGGGAPDAGAYEYASGDQVIVATAIPAGNMGAVILVYDQTISPTAIPNQTETFGLPLLAQNKTFPGSILSGETFGAASIIAEAAPETPPATPLVPSPTIILPRQTRWRFLLADSATLDPIGELSRGVSARSLDMTLNRGGSASFTIDIFHSLAASILEVDTAVMVLRDDEPIWSGPVWVTDDDLNNSRCTVTAVGWFEILNRRFLPADLYDYSQVETDAGEIAFGLLAQANAVANTFLTAGTVIPTQKRLRTYLRGANVGNEIIALSDIEAGYDFSIDPETRVFDVHEALRNDLRDSIHFRFGSNVASMRRTRDASSMANRMTVIGPYGSAQQDDFGSQALYGTMLEDYVSLSDVPEPEILLAYANAELAIRAQPKTTYSVVPLVNTNRTSRVPEPLRDYAIGDIVYLSANYGRVRFKQAVRVFGLQIEIDDNGNGRVGELRLAP